MPGGIGVKELKLSLALPLGAGSVVYATFAGDETESTSLIVVVNSLKPVLGTMIVLRRPCASSVIRKNFPRSFSRNSTKKCFRSTCNSRDAMTLSMVGALLNVPLPCLYRGRKLVAHVRGSVKRFFNAAKFYATRKSICCLKRSTRVTTSFRFIPISQERLVRRPVNFRRVGSNR